MKKTLLTTSLIFAGFCILMTDASAQTASAQQGFSSFAGFVKSFNDTVVKAVGTLFMSGAVVAFFYGIVQYIWGVRQGEPTKISAGNQFMVWGLVALFVMFSVYGIIKMFQIWLLPSGSNNSITIPDIQLNGGGGSNSGIPSGNTGGSSGGVPGGNTGGSSGGIPPNCTVDMGC